MGCVGGCAGAAGAGGGGCARASRGPRGAARGRDEVTTARYVYSTKPVIKNVSARAVCRPVIIQLEVSPRCVVTVTGNAVRGSARATGPSARLRPMLVNSRFDSLFAVNNTFL